MTTDSSNKPVAKTKGRPPKANNKTTSKSTDKKPVSKIKAEEVEETKEPIVEEVVTEEPKVVVKEIVREVVKEVPVQVESKKRFEPTDLITCRSVVNGRVYMEGSASLLHYTWMDFGDEVDVEYRDLVAAVRNKSGYIMRPFFVIMNDDFIQEFSFLKEIYAKQYSAKDLAKILSLDVNEMTEEIKGLPGNVKEILKGIASTWIENGRLDSFKKIKALDELLDTDLSLIADMLSE
jgi:hypothetical protein